MTKYEENIAKLVTEFNTALMALPGGDRVSLPDALFAFAKISVQREAEAAKDFHYAGWASRSAYDHPADGARQGQLEYMLQQKGLIPPKTETE